MRPLISLKSDLVHCSLEECTPGEKHIDFMRNRRVLQSFHRRQIANSKLELAPDASGNHHSNDRSCFWSSPIPTKHVDTINSFLRTLYCATAWLSAYTTISGERWKPVWLTLCSNSIKKSATQGSRTSKTASSSLSRRSSVVRLSTPTVFQPLSQSSFT